MVEIKNKSDKYVRIALWLSYNRKCFYCSELINYNNFQVDHIIPKSIEKEKVINKYGLRSDFKFDSYLNLVPTCFPCNNKKRAKQFDKKAILYYLNIAKSKIPEILKIEEKYKNENFESTLSAAIDIAQEKGTFVDILKALTPNGLTSIQQKALNEAIKKITPISSLSDKNNERLQIFSDEINLLSDEFSVLEPFLKLKGNLFSNKKIGIIIYKGISNIISYSLYPVSKDRNDLIKEIPEKDWYYLASKNIVSTKITDLTGYILDNPKKLAKDHIFNHFVDLICFNSIYDTKNLFLLKEFIIDFIDRHKRPFGLEIKKKYGLKELIFALFTYFPLWVDESVKRNDQKILSRIVNTNGYVDLDFLEMFTTNNEQIKKIILNRIKNKDFEACELTKGTPVGYEKIPIGLIPVYLKFLDEKNITIIERVYKEADYSRVIGKNSFKTIELYSDEDIIYNLEKIYKYLPDVYNDVIEKKLPTLKDDLKLYKDYVRLIIEIEKFEDVDIGRQFGIHKYFLKRVNGDDFKIIFYPNIHNKIPISVRKGKENILEFNGKNYEVDKRWERLDFIFQLLPMHKIIHETLKEHLLNLMKTDYKKVILEI